ncbi:MAG TPA: hypothetical protein VMU80_05955 [Bryobacteraceae bacterium]|nr:hypothetical protein [Bryobacteraceae bacterium]
MSETLSNPAQTATSPEDERWVLVHRILSSRHLLKAPQLRDILLYLARRTLNDDATGISEQEIGCKVLGRRPDFNPNEDNIVRVQVRRLRSKLEEYFASDGSDEPTVLTIPKGAYLLCFEPRVLHIEPQAVRRIPPANILAHAPVQPADSQPSFRRWTVILATLLVTALGLTSLILWRQREALKRPDEIQPRRNDVLWSRIFVPGRETDIVVADTCLVAIQDILDLDISLTDYRSGGYPDKLIGSVPNKGLQAALRLLADRQYTSLGDASVATRLMELSHRYGVHTNIRYPRFMSVRDFKNGNFIFIGSRRGLPWEQLFEPQLNFALEEDQATRQYRFRNKTPLPGEQATYQPSAGSAASADTYADIALLPNLAGNGYVLILAGIDMAATEAAGELVASQDFPDILAGLLRSKGRPPASYLEILVHEKLVGGAAEGSKIIAYRVLSGPKPAS